MARKMVSLLLSLFEVLAALLLVIALAPFLLVMGAGALHRRVVIWSQYGGDEAAYDRDCWKNS